MIYASLPTIRAWNQPLVAPLYVALALATGGVLMNLLLAAFAYELRWAAIGTVLILVFGAILKRLYWTAIDTAARTYTAESATGLGRFGTVRPLDPPHTQPNFVMREMGYQVARRHAERLRRLSAALLFLLPIVAGLLLLLNPPNSIQIAIAALSALSAVAGVLTSAGCFSPRPSTSSWSFTVAAARKLIRCRRCPARPRRAGFPSCRPGQRDRNPAWLGL
jgi:DMSO reductase anchor subunit